jgi:Asp-tRNA(Asn)/Glu-tRNA(Gln) amidotransferase A subunit family amidase
MTMPKTCRLICAGAALAALATPAAPPPFGVSFTGMACAEARLIGLAFAFEQATKRRASPPLN